MTAKADFSGDSVAGRIARAWSAEFSLELDREAVSFLAGIHAFIEFNPEPFLSEEQLRQIFSLVSELAHGDPNTLQTRATRATARLREQQLLVRGDLGGVAQEGEYGLSQLGKALAEWVLHEEALTRESLETMMTRIRADLIDVKAAAEHGGDDAHWEKRVVAPLKFTVSGLMQMIDRRSRGLDREQEAVRQQVGVLLEAGWFDAIESCESLLEEVSRTLGELHRALMSETEGASTLLTAIMEAADLAQQLLAQEAAGHVRMQLERVNLWGEARFRAWSDYYQNVHEFIRSVVRVDRDRALRGRLKQAIQNFGTPSWGALVTAQEPYRHLRELAAISQEERIGRPAGRHTHNLEDGQQASSPWDALQPVLLDRLKQDGRLDLLRVLQEDVGDWSEEQKFGLVSVLIPWLAENGRPDPWRDFDWQEAGERLALQNLTILAPGSHRERGQARAGQLGSSSGLPFSKEEGL